MKKLLYITVFALVAGFSISSCTEEVVKPKDQLGGSGIKE